MMSPLADLHVHTTFSDGSHSPGQVVNLARRAALTALAITDHDTTAGIAPGRREASDHGLELVPGVELTTEWRGRELHLLGYYFDVADPPLQRLLSHLGARRWERFRAMAVKLRRAGLRIDAEALDRGPGRGVPGRRHLALELWRSGQVDHVRDAFRKYLYDGGPADVAKDRVPMADAIERLRAAGGVAVLAHPPYDFQRESFAGLVALGLQGIEVAGPRVPACRVADQRRWAEELDLIPTAGSDHHGDQDTRCWVGACSTPGAVLDRLRRQSRHGSSVLGR